MKLTDRLTPATGAEIGTYADGIREDPAAAIEASHRAFRLTDWKDNRKLRAHLFEARRDSYKVLVVKHHGSHVAVQVGYSYKSFSKTGNSGQQIWVQ